MTMAEEPSEALKLNAIDRDYIFLMFALMECGRALRALEDVQRLAAVKEDRGEGVERREWIRVFDAIRSALHFAGSVSRLFFPQTSAGATARARGERLRHLTSIPEDHPISDRALRNHVEHMDERLDIWTANAPRPFVAVEMRIDPDDAQITTDAVEKSSPFLYYTEAQEVVAFGDRFSLPSLSSTLEEVKARVLSGFDVYRDEKKAAEQSDKS